MISVHRTATITALTLSIVVAEAAEAAVEQVTGVANAIHAEFSMNGQFYAADFHYQNEKSPHEADQSRMFVFVATDVVCLLGQKL